MDLFELTKALINIPSVTGTEGGLAYFLVSYLKEIGFDVQEQTVEERRRNVFAAHSGKPKVIFCTHMDTVAGRAVASEDGSYIYGRGACDAKGIMAAMIAASREMRADGMKDVGLLFVVGEETDSIGAQKANDLNVGSKYLVVGEPTENKLAAGHKGILTVKLTSKGRRAHSAFPHLGESAVEKLLDVLEDLRQMDFGEDKVLGRSPMNIGLIEGGVASNVIPDSAGAVISVRTAVVPDMILERIVAAAGKKADVCVITKSEPQILYTLPGFETAVMPYGSDIPHLKSFGKPLLLGPGSVVDAHSENEKIEKKQLLEAVEIYKKLGRRLLAEN